MLKILMLLCFLSFEVVGQNKPDFVVMKGLPFSLNTYTSISEEDIDMIKGKSRFDIIDTIWNVTKIKSLHHKLRTMVKITKKKHEDYDLRLGLYFYKNSNIEATYFFDSNQNIVWNNRLYKIKKIYKADIINILPKPVFKDSLVNENKFWER